MAHLMWVCGNTAAIDIAYRICSCCFSFSLRTANFCCLLAKKRDTQIAFSPGEIGLSDSNAVMLIVTGIVTTQMGGGVHIEEEDDVQRCMAESAISQAFDPFPPEGKIYA